MAMTEEEKQEFQALVSKIEDIETFVEAKKRQQISFPLDTASKTIINDI